MLNSVETSTIDYSNTLVENLIGSNQVRDVKFVRINDIIEKQNEGKLLFSISDGLFPDQKLSAVDVDYQDANQYTWSGSNHEVPFTATFIKDKNGYSGSIYDSNDLYRIFPITNRISALIKMNKVNNRDACGILPHSPTIPENSSAVIDCDTECAGHIDILFLLRPDVQEWIGHQNLNTTYLNFLIAELNLVCANSEINHTFDYNWVDFEWKWDGEDGTVDDNCFAETIDLSHDSEAISLRDQYNADIVVMLRSDDPWPANPTTGCTTIDALTLTPGGDGAFIIFETQTSLLQPIFSHEVGHVFGAHHFFDLGSQYDSDRDLCSYGHKLNFYEEDQYGYPQFVKSLFTVMYQLNSGILHYSDPDIDFESVPTGKPVTFTNSGLKVPANNNAGQIRGAGCFVSGFRDSPNINGVISISEENCLLNLNASIQPLNAEYEYSWYWSYDGIFSNLYPGVLLGEGDILLIEEPVSNPCADYFIQMVVSLDGEIVETEVVNQDGGICAVNVQDCDGSSDGFRAGVNPLYILNPSTINSFESNKLRSELSRIEIHYVVDISGRVLFVNEEKLQIEEIENKVSGMYKGLYFIVGRDVVNNIITRKKVSF